MEAIDKESDLSGWQARNRFAIDPLYATDVDISDGILAVRRYVAAMGIFLLRTRAVGRYAFTRAISGVAYGFTILDPEQARVSADFPNIFRLNEGADTIFDPGEEDGVEVCTRKFENFLFEQSGDPAGEHTVLYIDTAFNPADLSKVENPHLSVQPAGTGQLAMRVNGENLTWYRVSPSVLPDRVKHFQTHILKQVLRDIRK